MNDDEHVSWCTGIGEWLGIAIGTFLAVDILAATMWFLIFVVSSIRDLLR